MTQLIKYKGFYQPDQYVTVSYEHRRSGADMQYKYQVVVDGVSSPWTMGYPIVIQVSIAGKTIETTQLKAALPNQYATITHTSDWITVAGVTSGTVALSIKSYTGYSTSDEDNSVHTGQMVVDPAASKIDVNAGELGVQQTINIIRYDSSFTHTIVATDGYNAGKSVTIATKSASTSFSWTPPVNFASARTDGANMLIKITCTTYSGSTVVGSVTASRSYKIPDSVKPGLSMAVSDPTGYAEHFGSYIEGQSKVKVELTKTLAYGSPIKTYSVKAGSFWSVSTDGGTSGIITNTGAVNVTAAITDGRGRGATAETTIQVSAYAVPQISGFSAVRCKPDGTEDQSGASIKVSFSAVITALSDQNTAAYKVQYREAGSSNWTDAASSATGYSVQDTIILPTETSKAYEVQVVATDYILSISSTMATVGVAFKIADVYPDGSGICFGGEATKPNTFEILLANFEFNGKTLLDMLHPVNSIFETTDPTDPAELFGGTWELYGVGKVTVCVDADDTDFNAAGKTGGEKKHTLTKDEMPAHNHPLALGYGKTTADNPDGYWERRVYGYVGTSTANIHMQNTGGGQAHNNMPPYITLYRWRRTA